MGLKISSTGWWERDVYDVDALVPEQLEEPLLWGPKGAALVKVYPDGSTQSGWGLTPPKGSSDGFIPRYLRNEFHPRKAQHWYDHGDNAAAYVMRAGKLMVVDIDGKNGGLQGVWKLGSLPYTLSEVSKSGNGYHLFFRTDEVWDDTEGYAQIPDHIGIVPGVDIRGVGCVYHHASQRWNNREIAPLPTWLRDRLIEKKQQRTAQAVNIIKTLTTLDPTEVLIMQTELIEELKRPIPAGKRNITLFAIGSKLKLAEVPDWETLVAERATDLGLGQDEADKLVGNIAAYA